VKVLTKYEILDAMQPMITHRGILLFLYEDEIVYAGQSDEAEHRIYVQAKSDKEFDAYVIVESKNMTTDEITDLLAEYIVEYTPVYDTLLPTNSKWAALNTIRRLSSHPYNDIKRHIKANRIKGKNGFYLLADFAEYL